MKRTLLLYYRLAEGAIRSKLQHRSSFIMLLFAHALATCADLVGIWILFDRFCCIKSWTIEELAIVYGTLQMSFAIADGLGRGFDRCGRLVKAGDFDRVLLRPTSSLLQVAASDIEPFRMGRCIQGFLVLLWGFCQLDFSLFSFHTLVILSSFLGTTALFYGAFILQGAVSFWTVESQELVHIASYASLEAGQYPISIYAIPLRLFFICVVPIGCSLYYPIASQLHHGDLPVAISCLLPFVGVLFLFMAGLIWQKGVRRYSVNP